MQCIIHSPSFRKAVQTGQTNTLKLKRKNSLEPVVKLAKSYFAPENETSYINPSSFLKHVTRKHRYLHIGRQEDAHEFLRCVVDELHESEVLKGKELSLAQHVWGFYLESCVRCLRCNNRSITRDAAMDLSLDISGYNIQTLEDAMDAFFVEEKLDRENKVDCDRCKKKRRSGKQFLMGSAPHVLACHLKRFDYTGRKLGKFIEYGEKLDVGPYIVRDTPNTAEVVAGGEDPFVPYRLFGVVVHSGSSQFGHYYAFVRPDPRSRRWWELNDRECRRAERRTALGQVAYILFYVRGGEGDDMAMHAVRRRLSLANMAVRKEEEDDDDDDDDDDDEREKDRAGIRNGGRGESERGRDDAQHRGGRGGASDRAAPAPSWLGSMFGWARAPTRASDDGAEGDDDVEAGRDADDDVADGNGADAGSGADRVRERAPALSAGGSASGLPTSVELRGRPGQFSSAPASAVVGTRNDLFAGRGATGNGRAATTDEDEALAEEFARANPNPHLPGPATAAARRRGGSAVVRVSAAGGGRRRRVGDRESSTTGCGCRGCVFWTCCKPERRRAPPGSASRRQVKARSARDEACCEGGCCGAVPAECRRFTIALLSLGLVALVVYVVLAATVAREWRPGFAASW